MPEATPPAPVKPVAATLPDVIARVNGETIDKAEFEKAIRIIEAQNGGPVPAEQRDRVYRNVLDQMIGFKLLRQESIARKVAAPETEVEARIGTLRRGFPTEDAFNQALKQQNVTVDQLRADARSELSVTKMLEAEIEPKSAAKPEQVQEFYEKNPEHFKVAEQARASHILITVAENADAATRQAAKTKAESILKDVKAGKDFAALARQHSQDPGSAQNGGDLSTFGRGQMVPQFDEVVFSMNPGQTSELVETQFGYHIIKVTERIPARTKPLDEVRTDIENYLQNQNRQQLMQAFVGALKTKARIEILI